MPPGKRVLLRREGPRLPGASLGLRAPLSSAVRLPELVVLRVRGIAAAHDHRLTALLRNLNYVKRGDARGTWLETHYRWQIRTFWCALLATAAVMLVFVTLIRPQRRKNTTPARAGAMGTRACAARRAVVVLRACAGGPPPTNSPRRREAHLPVGIPSVCASLRTQPQRS
jgi:uncharacterized membrane protein